MKGSAVVNGFKSLASRIHEQLPLSPKESNRLLTALTSSFRKHLDEVHPKTAGEDVRPKPNSQISTAKIEKHNYSSAALADKHLASVLTNPLLARSASPTTRASEQAALTTAFAKTKDPIALLESYEQKGKATPAAALACVRRFKQLVPAHVEQVKTIKNTRFGTRLLACFLQAKLYECEEFVDQHGLREALVWAVMFEGRDEFLWEWLKLDLKLLERDHVITNETDRRESRGQLTKIGRGYSDYRWKGRMLRAMVETAFGPPHTQNKCGDAALNVYLKACRLRRQYASDSSHYMHWLPIEPARNMVCQQLMLPGRPWRNTDPDLYDEVVESFQVNRGNAMVFLASAELMLHHPVRPTAMPHYTLLHQLYSGDSSIERGEIVRKLIEAPKTEGAEVKMFFSLLLSSIFLRAQGLHRESNWMRALVHKYFPSKRIYMQRDLNSLEAEYQDVMLHGNDNTPSQTGENDQRSHERIPYPFPQVS